MSALQLKQISDGLLARTAHFGARLEPEHTFGRKEPKIMHRLESKLNAGIGRLALWHAWNGTLRWTGAVQRATVGTTIHTCSLLVADARAVGIARTVTPFMY